MNSESKVIAEIWDLVRDSIPSARRLEIAIAILRSFEEFGFDDRDMQDIFDEDVYLSRAYADLYGDDKEEDEEE